MGILEDLFEFVRKRPKDKTTLQKIVKEIRVKISKSDIEEDLKRILMTELDSIDKQYNISRKGRGFDESRALECYEKLENFTKRNLKEILGSKVEQVRPETEEEKRERNKKVESHYFGPGGSFPVEEANRKWNVAKEKLNEAEGRALPFKKKREDELKEQYLNWKIDPIKVRKKMEEWGYAEDLIETLVGRWAREKSDIWRSKIKQCKTAREIRKVMNELDKKLQELGGITKEDYDMFHYEHGLKKFAEDKLQEFEGEEPGEKEEGGGKEHGKVEKLIKKLFGPSKTREVESKREIRQKKHFDKLHEKINSALEKTDIPEYLKKDISNALESAEREKEGGNLEEAIKFLEECKKRISDYSKYGEIGLGRKEKIKKKVYEGKPSENVEKYTKVILPFVAIAVGLIILILLPGLWIIGIPAIIIGSIYLLILIPEIEGFGFKQKMGVLFIIVGILVLYYTHSLYGLAIAALGGVFVLYKFIPEKGKIGKTGIAKIIELGITLILLVAGVPAFLSWSGITISWPLLAAFSALNTFLLFMLWSFKSGKSMKESLEKELLEEQIKKTKGETERGKKTKEKLKRGGKKTKEKLKRGGKKIKEKLKRGEGEGEGETENEEEGK